MRKILQNLRDFDRSRKSLPGEHMIVATVGSFLLNAARRRSGLSRVAMMVAGGALLARAASGRDGLRKLARPAA
jgi:uncharacterized membrane protein